MSIEQSHRRVVWSLFFYYPATIMYIGYSFLLTTLFSTIIPNSVFSLFKYICLCMFIMSILISRFSKRQILIVFWGVLLAILIFHSSGDSTIVLLIAFLLSSMNMRLSNVISIYFIINIILILITIIASLIGIIDNYSYVVNGSTRLAFGFLYTTDFAAHIFYLTLSFAFIIRKHINVFLSLIPACLGLIIFYFTRAKLDTILMLLITIALVCYQYTDLTYFKKLSIFMTIMPFSMALISVGLSWVYEPTNQLLARLDSILTNRLAMGHLALYEYPIKFFGQYISQNGSGGLSFDTGLTPAGSNLAYFFIDSAYIKTLLAFGIVFFLLYLFGMSRSIYLNIKKANYMLPILLGLICISSVIDQHMLEIAYNPFLISIMTAQLWEKEKVAVKA